jgi:hypothetical protein
MPWALLKLGEALPQRLNRLGEALGEGVYFPVTDPARILRDEFGYMFLER